MPEKNKRTVREELHLIKRAVKLINSETPHFVAHCALFSFCYAFMRVASNYITASIVDELTGDRRIKVLIFLLSCYLIEVVLRVVRDYSWRCIRTFDLIAPKWAGDIAEQQKLLYGLQKHRGQRRARHAADDYRPFGEKRL